MPAPHHHWTANFSSDLNENHSNKRTIKSFVRREGRLTQAQARALDQNWANYGIDFDGTQMQLTKVFQRCAPLVVDIGVGTGDSTIHHASQHPENDYLAIEVHRPGVGHLLNEIEKKRIRNIRVINHDVIPVLEQVLPDHSVSHFFIFFPDPWPKKRHHKRRLVSSSLIDLIKIKLAWHGRLHIATDWQNYAEHISELCDADKDLVNLAGPGQYAPRPRWRSKTRYEMRGERLQHEVRDFCYALSQNSRS